MTSKDIARKAYKSATVPLFMVLLLWVVKWLENIFGADVAHFGILPGKLAGLKGIITSPFIHADYGHLINNSVPLFVSGTLLFYFFDKIAIKVFPIMFISSGILTWIIARGNSYHIGASGGIYGLVTFVIVAGVLSDKRSLGAISMLLTFLYGSMIWGLIPIDYTISWEGHLAGAISGMLAAVYFRKHYPVEEKPAYETNSIPDFIGDAWMTDEQRAELQIEEEVHRQQDSTAGVHITYVFTPKVYTKQDSNSNTKKPL
ncbi:MAG: rhomboid family intramembrane serine protease [Bacteroidetes bacterium]|nr:rhomboid family intramembrane serine protease [Bacteroidota bacterium]